MENTASAIATVVIVAMAISGCHQGHISVMGCVIDCSIFFLIGFLPLIVEIAKKKKEKSEQLL